LPNSWAFVAHVPSCPWHACKLWELPMNSCPILTTCNHTHAWARGAIKAWKSCPRLQPWCEEYG